MTETARPEPARRELGAALRELLDAVVQTDADDAELARLARDVDELRSRLQQVSRRAVLLAPSEIHGELSLVGGASHPVGPQLRFASTAEGSVGTTTLRPVFQGAPGLAHGGVLGMLLDHAMGHARLGADEACE